MRNQWKFRLPSSRVADAAKAKAAHHRERETYWQNELASAQTALKSAVEFREHDVTGGKQVALVVDPEKQQHVNRCSGKRDEHRSQAENYEAYEAALRIDAALASSIGVELDVDDIRYFGLTQPQ